MVYIVPQTLDGKEVTLSMSSFCILSAFSKFAKGARKRFTAS